MLLGEDIFRYFGLGSIELREDFDSQPRIVSPNEFALDLSYSLKLTEEFSMAVAGRFVNSNLKVADVNNDGFPEIISMDMFSSHPCNARYHISIGMYHSSRYLFLIHPRSCVDFLLDLPSFAVLDALLISVSSVHTYVFVSSLEERNKKE